MNINLVIDYYSKLIYHPEQDEEGLVVKTHFKPIKIREMPRFGTLEEKLDPGKLYIEEKLISIPSVYHMQQLPYFFSEGQSKYIEFLERFLLDLCERDLRYHLANECIKNNLDVDLILEFRKVPVDELY